MAQTVDTQRRLVHQMQGHSRPALGRHLLGERPFRTTGVEFFFANQSR